jgi:glycerophosphoryl diester phosphodiesterase
MANLPAICVVDQQRSAYSVDCGNALLMQKEMEMQNPPVPDHTPWRIAHRGARDEAPENTRAAFERALEYPIDGIELDIRMSADGVPVIQHDPTLWRIARQRRRIAEQTYAQLTRLDWGGWFHRNYSGEPLLTLERTLSLFGGRTRLLLEIKASPADQASGHAERLTRTVVEQVGATRHGIFGEHLFVLSFDPHLLRLAHHLDADGQYVLNVPQRHPELTLGLMTATETLHLTAICVDVRTLSEALVSWARARALRVFTYTCNAPRQVRKATRLGVDAILTDRPGWLTRYLDGGAER